ncbi:hypothetical protein T03_17222 [Trichinella britovi]|uniref:Uncharacterized protein n=1 Tax=Trichinella britovi TaxID=45882 RepID=A0A0V1C3I4_TRIBR|nr:hypothetical protein T03_17222 [Trichinella britovi]
MHDQCAPDPWGYQQLRCWIRDWYKRTSGAPKTKYMPSKRLARRKGEVIKTNRLNEQANMVHLS